MRVKSRESRDDSRPASGRRKPADALTKSWRVSETTQQGAYASLSPVLSRRHAFTLTELLVVMVILVILTTMTVYAVNFSFASERSRGAARQVQSYLEGARDRAIYERRPVGVRFLLDPNIADTASSMVYVEEIEAPTGSLTVTGATTVTRDISGSDPSWELLQNKGLLIPGAKIRIPADDSGFWHTIQSVQITPASPPTPKIEEIVVQPDIATGASTRTFKLKLPPVVRPNQEPMLLPRGIVLDLVRSQLPAFWGSRGSFIERLDVMFTPRGTVTGRAASSGLFHFYLSEAADVERLTAATPRIDNVPSDTPYGTSSDDDVIGDRMLVTLFPQTGAVSSHPIDPTDSDMNNEADDPFRFAELGEVAGE